MYLAYIYMYIYTKGTQYLKGSTKPLINLLKIITPDLLYNIPSILSCTFFHI